MNEDDDVWTNDPPAAAAAASDAGFESDNYDSASPVDDEHAYRSPNDGLKTSTWLQQARARASIRLHKPEVTMRAELPRVMPLNLLESRLE